MESVCVRCALRRPAGPVRSWRDWLVHQLTLARLTSLASIAVARVDTWQNSPKYDSALHLMRLQDTCRVKHYRLWSERFSAQGERFLFTNRESERIVVSSS